MVLDPDNEMRSPDQDVWTIKRILQSSAIWLRSKNPNSQDNHRLESEIMLSSVLGLDRMSLYLDLDRPLTHAERDQYRSLLMQRGAGAPVAYIVGYRDFYRHRFFVTKDTLIPRPDTECLVEGAIDYLRGFELPRVLDIGTGTGCIGISIAASLPGAEVEAWDISEAALAVAKMNAETIGTTNITMRLCDGLLEDSYGGQKFHAIVSNPPYIPWDEKPLCAPETLKFEPQMALFADDPDGLTFYRRFATSASKSLCDGGKIFLEVGFNQGEKVAHLFEGQGWRKIVMIRDLSGHKRAISAERP